MQKIGNAIIEAIAGAPHTETASQIAARLGVSERTVRTYRRDIRDRRQEAAREAIAEHVQAAVPDVLADLNELRALAGERYRKSENPRHGALWLNAIKTTLEHVSPSDADIDAAIEAELAQLAQLATNGKAAAHRADQGT